MRSKTPFVVIESVDRLLTRRQGLLHAVQCSVDDAAKLSARCLHVFTLVVAVIPVKLTTAHHLLAYTIAIHYLHYVKRFFYAVIYLQFYIF